jgi:hypothetical protein
MEHILKANVYLANMPRDFGPMNEAYIKASRIHRLALSVTAMHGMLFLLRPGYHPRFFVSPTPRDLYTITPVMRLFRPIETIQFHRSFYLLWLFTVLTRISSGRFTVVGTPVFYRAPSR